MLDTMTMTKVVGAFCGALLVFLLGNWAAEALYHVGEEGHGDEVHQAYVIDTGAEEGGGEAEEGPSFEEVYAEADAGRGERVFGKCRACHKIDGTNTTGPHLDGVVGREIDSVEGYDYSGALEQVGDVWSPENLNHFLTNPREAAPGTKMGFAGLKDVEDRANVIAYLDSLGG